MPKRVSEEIICEGSSNIHSAAYYSSKVEPTMVVRFKASRDDHVPRSAYEYIGVTEDTWLEFKRSTSKGRFVRYLLIGKYPCRMLWNDDREKGA